MTKILGISAFYHDSSATLLNNGKIICAIQEERFSRVKNDKTFPLNSINYIFKRYSINIKDIDAIVFYENPKLKFDRIIKNILTSLPRGFLLHFKTLNSWLTQKLFYKKIIYNSLLKINQKCDKKKIYFVDHHISHAASAFFPSNFDESVILTMDGVGEKSTTTIGYGKNNKIQLYENIEFPDSLGLLYSAFTFYLGFKVNSGEYKLMGLAPYGEAKYKDLILNNLIRINDDGSFKLNMNYFSYQDSSNMINKNFINLFNSKPRKSDENITKFHMDIAASIQAVLEIAVIKIVRYCKRKFPNIDNICLAGGVALNCVANGKISREKIFKNTWIQPAAGDAGGSLGAALYYWFNQLDNKRDYNNDIMQGSYLGTTYSDKQILDDLTSLGAIAHLHDMKTITKIVAKKISEGFSVGWFQDRMEFGPRALGNRSILADPRDNNMQKNLNLKIKFRESFRPFAPAVMKEYLSEWFELEHESPYMLFVSEIKKKYQINIENYSKEIGFKKLSIKKSKIPAVTHVDMSARIQTVSKETNKKFYNLLNEFFNITGVPILINTSFNVRGEPIVCSPKDAFNCFMGTNLDMLVCNNVLLYKDEQKKEKFNKNFKNSFIE